MNDSTNITWHYVAQIDEIEDEDVLQATIGEHLLAIYNTGGQFYASDDLCTHGHALLSEGLVIDNIIECPLHQGRFDIRNGDPKGAPVCEKLTTYQTKVEDDKVFVAFLI
jgi:nitrite reductase/ring-hydroxylating ferredoxin subunit